MLISLGVSHCSSGEKWLSSWQQENPSLKTNQVYSFYPYYTYYLEVLTCSLCLSCYTRFQLHYLLCLCLYFGKGGVYPRKVLMREWPHSFYTSAGGIRAEIGWWEKAQAQWARTFFLEATVWMKKKEERLFWTYTTTPCMPFPQYRATAVLHTLCVCKHFSCMKTHTAFWYTGEEKEKRIFPKEQQNIQLKTGCCSGKTPCFLSGLLVTDAAEHLESFVLNVHLKRFILLKMMWPENYFLNSSQSWEKLYFL